jgi:hypothetical protein
LQDDGWPHTDLVVDGRDAREAAEVRKVVSIERAREAVGREGRRREKARGARVCRQKEIFDDLIFEPPVAVSI